MSAAAFKSTVACAGVSIFLAACRTSGIPRELDLPVSREQQTLAIDEARKFREGFNKGACQAIYDEAWEPFRHQPQQDWMSQCAELRGIGTLAKLRRSIGHHVWAPCDLPRRDRRI